MTKLVGDEGASFGKPHEEPAPTAGKDVAGHTHKIAMDVHGMPAVPTGTAEAGAILSPPRVRLLGSVNEEEELIKLGCPPAETAIIAGRGYFERYARDLESLPQPAALALLTMAISQDLAISLPFRRLIRPDLAETGTSGVYFLKDFSGKKIFVFKPQNEEMFMSACPHKSAVEREALADPEHPLRRTIQQGSAMRNEIVAAAVAHEFGLAVPVVYYAEPELYVRQGGSIALGEARDEAKVSKPGSLQEFKEGEILGILSPTVRSRKCDEVCGEEAATQIALTILMDITIGNTDRHFGNVIIGKSYHPIDHGLVFPDGLSLTHYARTGSVINETFIAIDFPYDDHEEAYERYLKGVDPDKIAMQMREGGITESAVEEMYLRYHFVKMGLEKGVDMAVLLNKCHMAKQGDVTPLSTAAMKAIASLGFTRERLREPTKEQFARYLEEFKKEVALLF